MKNIFSVLICLASTHLTAQTKKIATETVGLEISNFKSQKDDFGAPSPHKIIDTVTIVNDSVYIENYFWTHANWHSGNAFGKDTLYLRNSTTRTVLHLYSTAFSDNFNNPYFSGKKTVMIYPKNSKKLQEKANTIKYSEEEKSSFKYAKKGSLSYLFTFILVLGAVASLIHRKSFKL